MLDYANSMGRRWKKEEITNFSTFIFLVAVAVAVLFFNNVKCRAIVKTVACQKKNKGHSTLWRVYSMERCCKAYQYNLCLFILQCACVMYDGDLSTPWVSLEAGYRQCSTVYSAFHRLLLIV